MSPVQLTATSGAELATAWGTCLAAGATLLAVAASLWLSSKSERSIARRRHADFELDVLMQLIQEWHTSDGHVGNLKIQALMLALPIDDLPVLREVLGYPSTSEAREVVTKVAGTTRRPVSVITKGEVYSLVTSEISAAISKRSTT